MSNSSGDFCDQRVVKNDRVCRNYPITSGTNATLGDNSRKGLPRNITWEAERGCIQYLYQWLATRKIERFFTALIPNGAFTFVAQKQIRRIIGFQILWNEGNATEGEIETVPCISACRSCYLAAALLPTVLSQALLIPRSIGLCGKHLLHRWTTADLLVPRGIRLELRGDVLPCSQPMDNGVPRNK